MIKTWSQFKAEILFSLLIAGLFIMAIQMQPLIRHDAAKTLVVLPDVNVSDIPDFGAIVDVQLKKQTFFTYLQPYIDKENRQILLQREALKSIQTEVLSGKKISDQSASLLSSVSQKYEIESSNLESIEHLRQLLKRIDVIPSSLVLAQAANESAWGSSRFAQMGNNFFGQWCYTPGCGIVPSRRGADAIHEVRRFASVGDSVHAYFMNLNTFSSYENLREIRQQLRDSNRVVDGISLSEGLGSYSERGDEYIWELQSMIYSNQLTLLDEA